MKIFVAVSFGD